MRSGLRVANLCPLARRASTAVWLGSMQLTSYSTGNLKNSFLSVGDTAPGSVRTIHEIDEDKFWSIPDWGEAGAQPWPSPNGKWIAFLSDQHGWDHLYGMPGA